MYTILIVEDEKIERESLQSMIEGFSLPFAKIILAENGEQGFAKYNEYKPDVILADINMPVLGGLEMMEEIRKLDENVVCLILTSYDYFSYAQKAIRLGVEDFILKPADKQTLFNSLIQIVESLQRNKNTYAQTSSLVQKMNNVKNILKSECFYSILTKQNEFKLLEKFKMANIFATSALCLIFKLFDNNRTKLEVMIKELEEIGYTILSGIINQQCIIFIISNHKISQSDYGYIQKLTSICDLDGKNSALGSIQEDMTQFYKSYEDALYNLNSNLEFNSMVLAKDKEYELYTLAKEWSNVFLDCTKEELQNKIRDICHEFLRFDYNETNKIVSLMIEDMIDEIDKQYQLKFEKSDFSFRGVNNQNYQNLEIIMTQLLNKIMKPLENIKYQNSSYLIKKSMVFIEENYHKSISLNSLADTLGVSPFYISKLFSKELHRNFTEIVNDMRIKEAKKLICRDYSFKEVAYKVGYASQSYFTKVFKKNVGMSPKEYRKLFP